MKRKLLFSGLFFLIVFVLFFCNNDNLENNIIKSVYNKLFLNSSVENKIIKIYDKVAEGAVIDNTVSDTVGDADGIYFGSVFGKTNGIGNFLLSGTENNKYPIYYYRGGVNLKNRVIFSNLCFRIVRTTETGGVKLLFDGFKKNGECTDTYSGYPIKYLYVDYNLSRIVPEDVGYMYDNNTIDSNIKEITDDWYVEYIGNDGRFLEDTVWCNDRRIAEGTDSSSIIYYAAYKRLDRKVNQPSLDCPVVEDRFTVNGEYGNGKLTYPIGQLTADELVYAGGVKDSIFSDDTYFSTTPFYTMTPYYYYPYGTVKTDGARNFISDYKSLRSTLVKARDTEIFYLRPSISLSNDVYILTGDGSTENPYIAGSNNISDYNISISYDSISYTGKELEPTVTVMYEGYKFTKDVEYSVKYENNVEVGTASVIIEGINGYDGKVIYNFEITPANISYTSNDYIGTYDRYSHTGSVKVSSSVKGAIVKYGLTKGTYNLTQIPSFVNVGTYTVYFQITAYGYNTVSSSLNVTIKKNELIYSDVVLSNRDSEIYNGEEITKEISVYDGSKKLLEDIDYKVTYTDNIDVGTAYIIVEGLNNYGGKVETYFNIIAADIEYKVNEYDGTYDYNSHSISIDLIKPDDATIIYSSTNNYINVGEYRVYYQIKKDNYNTVSSSAFVKIKAKDISNFDFELGEYNSIFDFSYKKPSIVVKDNDYVLVEGKDYSIKYENNYGVGQASVIVTGKGNYSGSKRINFEIENANFVYKSDDYTGIYDYKEHGIILEVESSYSYKIMYGLESGVYDLEKMPLFKNVGSYNIYYKISSDNFNTITGYNTVTITAKDINDLTYNEIKSLVYDGNKKEPSLMIKDGDYTLSDNDYQVTYSNNVNAGQADVLVKGIGNFVGFKNLIFEIEKADMVYVSKDYEGEYDKEEHGILLEVAIPADVEIRYANEDGEYVLKKMPMYTNPGKYTIKFQLTDSNYNTIEDYNVVHIKPKGIDDFFVDDIDSYIFNNEYIKPSIIIKDKEYVMQEGIDYYLTYSNNLNVGTAEVTIHGMGIYDGTVSRNFMIHKAEIDYLAYDYEGPYDGIDHTISFDINISDYTIRYANEDGVYQLTNIPKYKEPGVYKIFYEIKSDNYHTVTGYKTVTIYGIDSIIDKNLELDNSILKIKNNNIDMLNLSSNIKILENDYTLNHLNSNKVLIDSPIIKTGDYIQILINDKVVFEYNVSKLGDVNGDGLLNLSDIMKIANYLYKNNSSLTGVYLKAVDFDNNESYNLQDIMKLANLLYKGGN